MSHSLFSECRNVTFAEDYVIIWEGKRIVEMKVTVLTGERCPEGIVLFLLQGLISGS